LLVKLAALGFAATLALGSVFPTSAQEMVEEVPMEEPAPIEAAFLAIPPAAPLFNLSRSASFGAANFREFDATSVANGNLQVVNGNTAIATVAGGDNAYARGQWEVVWGTNATYRTEMDFMLPSGFYAAQQGAVQLVGWDTFPVLNNQMRLAIWKSDKLARLFLKSDGADTELTNEFSIPEGRWVNLAIEQHIGDADGWSKVYLDGQLVAEGYGDTATPHAVTRIRYGLVAIDANVQRNPLSVQFSNVRLSEAR
jgi:hypothetical protein